ncbi:hypothetical protein, partial [Salmonella sp. gx-f5]|uniref:hypothetical protein n=1 Tax=Salmonella sp. gx-f5 TaxID=2582605 RepID=UPI001F2A456F
TDKLLLLLSVGSHPSVKQVLQMPAKVRHLQTATTNIRTRPNCNTAGLLVLIWMVTKKKKDNKPLHFKIQP